MFNSGPQIDWYIFLHIKTKLTKLMSVLFWTSTEQINIHEMICVCWHLLKCKHNLSYLVHLQRMLPLHLQWNYSQGVVDTIYHIQECKAEILLYRVAAKGRQWTFYLHWRLKLNYENKITFWIFFYITHIPYIYFIMTDVLFKTNFSPEICFWNIKVSCFSLPSRLEL